MGESSGQDSWESWPGMNRGSLSLRNCRQFNKVTSERVLFLQLLCTIKNCTIGSAYLSIFWLFRAISRRTSICSSGSEEWQDMQAGAGLITEDAFERILNVTNEQEAVMAYYYLDENNQVNGLYNYLDYY